VQNDVLNASGIRTVVIVSLSSNLELSTARGNVLVTAEGTGLAMDSVVNVTQLLTINQQQLEERIGRLTPWQMRMVESGLRMVFDL
jgi:mRNA interferase MazF